MLEQFEIHPDDEASYVIGDYVIPAGQPFAGRPLAPGLWGQGRVQEPAVRGGVPAAQLKLALAVHGPTTKPDVALA